MVVRVIDVVVHGFHIRVMFVVRGFDVSVTVVEVVFLRLGEVGCVGGIGG